MKVLILVDQAQTLSTQRLAAALRIQGVQVTVVCVTFLPGNGWLTVSAQRLADYTNDLSIQFVGKLSALLQGSQRLLEYLLRKKLAEHGILIHEMDVIHNFGLQLCGRLALRFAAKITKPCVLSPNTSELLTAMAVNPRPSWLNAALNGGCIVVESEASRHFAKGAKQVEVIMPEVVDGCFRYRPLPMGSVIHVVMAGIWNDEQPIIARPKLAIKALAEVEHQLEKPVTLSIIGEGDRHQELRDYCIALGIHAQFHGALNDEGMAREFHRANLFLHPTDVAAFPLFMLQAKKCGVPVLASDVPGMDAFSGGIDQSILVPNKLSAWKEGIVRALEQHYDREAIAISNTGNYGFEMVVEAHVALYAALHG